MDIPPFLPDPKPKGKGKSTIDIDDDSDVLIVADNTNLVAVGSNSTRPANPGVWNLRTRLRSEEADVETATKATKADKKADKKTNKKADNVTNAQ